MINIRVKIGLMMVNLGIKLMPTIARNETFIKNLILTKHIKIGKQDGN
jgi:hypothetical protein